MKRVDVSSSTLESVGYDEATQTLEVASLSGAVYQYHGVPMSVYRDLLAASKVGQFICAYIEGVYRQGKTTWRW